MKWLELRVPPPLVMAVVAVLMGFAARMLPALDFPVPARIALAVALALVGVLIGVVAIVQFWRARTTPNPMKPHDSSRLVDAGIYRLSRNPMYLGDACSFSPGRYGSPMRSHLSACRSSSPI